MQEKSPNLILLYTTIDNGNCRMSSEVEKSQAKTDKLRTELGEERMEIWRREHAAEVLAQQQAILAEKNQQH